MSASNVATRMIIVVLFLVAVSLPFTITSSSQTQDKPVEAVRKNIKVLNGMPDSQLLPVMNIMGASLGVKCDFCHVAEPGKFPLDDKPAKNTARQMIQMTQAINKTNFDGQTEVSCNTCHRGSTHPVSVPAFAAAAAAAPNTAANAPGERAAETRPSVDDVFNKYVQA